MQTKHMGLLPVTNYRPKTQAALISILGEDENEQGIIIPTSLYSKSISLTFDDADEEMKKAHKNLKIISQKQAELIIDFIDECYHRDSSIEEIVMHCKAGVSRSVAVHLFILEHYENITFRVMPPQFMYYNRKVYQELLKAFVNKHNS